MTQILVTKPGTLSQSDKAALRKAGAVAVEAEHPEDVRLLSVERASLCADDMVFAAITSLRGSGYRTDAREAFVKLLSEAMARKRETVGPSPNPDTPETST